MWVQGSAPPAGADAPRAVSSPNRLTWADAPLRGHALGVGHQLVGAGDDLRAIGVQGVETTGAGQVLQGALIHAAGVDPLQEVEQVR